jgi:hypothetical protein
MPDQYALEASEPVRAAMKRREEITARIRLLKDAKVSTVMLENDLSALDLKISDWKNALVKHGIEF